MRPPSSLLRAKRERRVCTYKAQSNTFGKIQLPRAEIKKMELAGGGVSLLLQQQAIRNMAAAAGREGSRHQVDRRQEGLPRGALPPPPSSTKKHVARRRRNRTTRRRRRRRRGKRRKKRRRRERWRLMTRVTLWTSDYQQT